VVHVETGAAALAYIAGETPDVVMLDLELPDMNGMEILKHIYRHHLGCAVVIITAHGSVDTAVAAMRYKALDFIEKPFDAKRLLVTVRNALQHRQLTRLLQVYRENFTRQEYHGFIGASLPMQAVYRIIESAAPSKASVFITGESGTGKELCAEAIHKQSPRRDKPFVALNCAAIPGELIESELFGHLKGAFTGASGERQGAASQADGGTLFLDEIGDMSLDLQSKLLRFIQTGSFHKVGGNKAETVDVRFLCATHRDPLSEVRAGRFREDLYYRLHVIPLHLPPLRERDGDVLLIARHFLQRYAGEEHKSFLRFSSEVEEVLSRYDWPGNVRQLQNIVHSIVVLNDAEEITVEMLPPPLVYPSRDSTAPNGNGRRAHGQENVPGARITDKIIPLWLVEKQAIEQAIELCEGNIPKAAALLEVSPSTLYRKRQRWAGEENHVKF
jgi:DNA-binding NtrC family response regulator